MQKQPDGSAATELPALTPLRGVAALWVVLYHYTFQCLPTLNSAAYTHLVQKGYLAVDMFFLLSGFVLTHVYHDAFDVADRRNYWKFISARIARLYPLHLFVLLIFVATAIVFRLVEYAVAGRAEPLPIEGPQSLLALAANLLMLQGLHARELSWNYPAWSISVEFLAYLAFPFTLPAIWRARPARQIALALALFGALCLLAYLTRGNFNQWDGPLTLLRCLPEFVLGTLLYSAFRRGACAQTLSSDAVALSLLAGVLLLLHLGAPDIMVVAMFAVLILALVCNAGYLARSLNVRPLIWLGTISYSLYLIHGLVQHLAPMFVQQGLGLPSSKELPVTGALALAAGMVVISLITGTITYHSVEVTGRRYLRRCLGMWRPIRATKPAC